MEKFKTSIIFDHRNRTAGDKEGPVEVRIFLSNKHYYINTGVRVRRSEWAGSVVNREDANALNDRLWFIVSRITEEITAMQKNGQAVDIPAVRDKVFAEEKKEEKDALLKWIEKEIPLLKIGSGTRRRYDVLLRRMQQYGGITRWGDLTTENLYAFDRWLHNIDKAQSNGDKQSGVVEKIGDAAVYNYHRTLRSLMTRAVKFGLLDANPYDKVRGEFRKGIKDNVEFLSEDEIAAIESLRPVSGTQMAMARDLFIFQLYTGLSYTDAQAFDIKNYKYVKGCWRAIGNRIKTGVAYVSDLLPQAVEVLEKYNMQVPKVNNPQYNESLKVIQQALGISTRLHSHLARHTFATTVTLTNGVPIESVSKMLGHRSLKTTQIYAKIVNDKLAEDMTNLSTRLQHLAM